MAKPFHYLAGAASDGHGFLPAVTCLEPTGRGQETVIHWLLYNPQQQFPDHQVAVAAAENELSGAFANPLIMVSDQALSTYLQTRGFVIVPDFEETPKTIDSGSSMASANQCQDPRACAEAALTNPVLQALILQTIDSQITGNDPPETGETLRRLVAQGYSADQAKTLIGAAIAKEILELYENHEPFNRERYVENLRRLPHLPSHRGDGDDPNHG